MLLTGKETGGLSIWNSKSCSILSISKYAEASKAYIFFQLFQSLGLSHFSHAKWVYKVAIIDLILHEKSEKELKIAMNITVGVLKIMVGSQPRFAWLQISQQERPDGFDVSISAKLLFVWIESYFSASHYY